ncbi:hypothetical protein GCM10025866_04800 [Naasia aerilata]|uniref:Endonuclease/exonuclease/phosphatase domain-containing protein n=1 Tax=Naasia aerilata TaxID=1162966 RepID=A0ABM8G8W3_9MICO|nr:hypothetical protein GCM10025866_04800 [Naasia aerilata]
MLDRRVRPARRLTGRALPGGAGRLGYGERVIRRALAAVVVLAVSGTLLALVWPQVFGLERTSPLAQAVSLRGAAALVAVVAAVLGTLLALLVRSGRRFFAVLSALLLAFAGVQVAVLAGRGLAGSSFETPSAATLTVLSWNTLGDAPGAERIAQLVIEAQAEVVALPETTRATAEDVAARARAAGLPLVAYTVAYDEVSKARSTSLLISSALGSYVVGAGASNTSVLPSIVAVPTGGGPLIISAHAVAPTPSNAADWRSDLAWLAAQCQGPDVVMAGDFNATVDHFTGLEGPAPDAAATRTDLGQCRDAGRLGSGGAVGTWPTWLPPFLGTPIDHVLATPPGG